MDEENKEESAPPPPQKSGEYGDAITDVLKDQVRRDELRSTAAPKTGRTRVHPAVPPLLALVSVWLWVFPPPALIPDVPTIPLAAQDAGLRMNMLVQVNQIQQFVSEYGRLPENLDQVGERPDGVQYTRLSDDVYQLTGKSGDVSVDYTSTESVDELVADAMTIVSGTSATPGGAGADD